MSRQHRHHVTQGTHDSNAEILPSNISLRRLSKVDEQLEEVENKENAGKTDIDVEKAATTTELVPGFTELAAFLSTDTERSIYPRFRDLGALNLVYKAAELASLRAQLRRGDQLEKNIIANPNHPRRDLTLNSATSFEGFEEAAEKDDYYKSKKAALEKLSHLISDYRSAIACEGLMNGTIHPTPQSARVLKGFLERKKGCVPELGQFIEESELKELETLEAAGYPDRLTRFIEYSVSRYQLRAFKQPLPASWGNIYDCANEKVTATVNSINAVVIVVTMVIAVLVLDASRWAYKPYMFTGICMVFAAWMALIMQAGRLETINAVAGFAAIFIVYMVGPGGST
ncbi:MAG: hypothetical protein M1831_002053 [Alyxoria varia]|nr:MAG: hypothetical protein M1831_002053 [Alyxoria varia]